MRDSGRRWSTSSGRRATCIAVAWLLGCGRAGPPPLCDDDPIPVLEATRIEPCGTPDGFERCGEGFKSTNQLALPPVVGTDLALVLKQVRQWLRREFGPVTDGLEFDTVRFYGDAVGGLLILRQMYRGIDTPGSLMFESTNTSQFAFVDLWSLAPASDPPSRVIPAAAAEAAAKKELDETPSAMTRIREGDRLVLVYFAVSDAGAPEMPAEMDDHARIDAFWTFRGRFDRLPHEPFVSARTGAVTFSVCGTSEALDEK